MIGRRWERAWIYGGQLERSGGGWFYLFQHLSLLFHAAFELLDGEIEARLQVLVVGVDVHPVARPVACLSRIF
jgi:hypothetical protein